MSDKHYVADSLHAWGRGFTEEDALTKLASNLTTGLRDDATLEVVVWEVEGFHGGASMRIDADEVHSETRYEMAASDLLALKEEASGVWMEAERCLVESETIDDE